LDKLIEKREGGADNKTASSKQAEERSVIDGSSLEQIALGMKLVPNMDQHDFLLKRMQLVGGSESGYNGLESTVEYNMLAMGDADEYPYFYEWNGARHMSFPTISFESNTIPYGDSVVMCMGL
jgi:hypothetical protein